VPTRVLVCDDAKPYRDFLRCVLALDAAVEVVGEAEDGQDAVDRMEALRPDVVVLDLQMPRMTGMDALPVLRANWPQSRVVVFSGDARLADAALAQGACAFVQKGADMAELLRAIAGAGAQAASAA
jgi:DNA-binding NarL/FixJ family response regulator